jgi:GT2 family glycosyltransferase
MAKIDLTIVILTYNSQFWLKKTLETLQEHYLAVSKKNIKVIVVDNASTDDTVKMLRKSFRWVELIESGSNNGFAVGNNLALKKVISPYAMLLNSDVEFVPQSNLDILLDYMEEHAEVGVITPKIQFTNGLLDLASHRGEPTLWASFTYFSHLGSFFPKSTWFGQYHQLYKDLNQIHSIDACSGAAMIVRKSALDKVGVLDERFFMYAEDLDWCRRFREAGYKIIYHPGVVVIHHKYKSGIKSASKEIARKTSIHFYDTMLQYYDKHYRKHYPEWVRSIIKMVLTLKKGAT